MYFERFVSSRLAGTLGEGGFTAVVIRIAAATVALSVCVMIVAQATILGFKQEISQKIFDFWGHIQVSRAYSTPGWEASPVDLPDDIRDSIIDIAGVTFDAPARLLGMELPLNRKRSTRGGVQRVYPFIQFPAVLTTRDDMEGLVLKGLDDQFPGDFFASYLLDGRDFERSGDPDVRELVISSVTASRMSLKPGDNVLIYFIREGTPRPRRFQVVGIYKTGLSEYDRKVAFMDLTHIQTTLQWRERDYSGLEIVLDDVADLPVINQFINLEVLPSELYTRTIRQVASSIFDWLDLQDINEVIILGLMMLVCVINMITALLILMLERTQMIGILKALGASNWQIRKIFVRQAGYILLWGLAIGNVLGLGLCLLQKKFQWVTLREEDYYLAVAPVALDLGAIVVVNAVTFGITLLCMLLPSYYVSRILPARSIRFS